MNKKQYPYLSCLPRHAPFFVQRSHCLLNVTIFKNFSTIWTSCKSASVQHLSTFCPKLFYVPLCFSHRYTIDRRTDMDRMFNIHAGNGSVFILRELDREENAWHNISIIATEFSKCNQQVPAAKLDFWSWTNVWAKCWLFILQLKALGWVWRKE